MIFYIRLFLSYQLLDIRQLSCIHAQFFFMMNAAYPFSKADD